MLLNNQTLVLGGLIRDRRATVNRGIPLLKDIPYPRLPLRLQGARSEKTELLILITPRVVGTALDAARVTDEYRRVSPSSRGGDQEGAAAAEHSAPIPPAPPEPSPRRMVRRPTRADPRPDRGTMRRHATLANLDRHGAPGAAPRKSALGAAPWTRGDRAGPHRRPAPSSRAASTPSWWRTSATCPSPPAASRPPRWRPSPWWRRPFAPRWPGDSARHQRAPQRRALRARRGLRHRRRLHPRQRPCRRGGRRPGALAGRRLRHPARAPSAWSRRGHLRRRADQARRASGPRGDRAGGPRSRAPELSPTRSS